MTDPARPGTAGVPKLCMINTHHQYRPPFRGLTYKRNCGRCVFSGALISCPITRRGEGLENKQRKDRIRQVRGTLHQKFINTADVPAGF